MKYLLAPIPYQTTHFHPLIILTMQELILNTAKEDPEEAPTISNNSITLTHMKAMEDMEAMAAMEVMEALAAMEKAR